MEAKQYTTRNDFGKLFQSIKKLGIGAEVGVRFGLFSKTIAKHWKGKIICVDLWKDREIQEVATVLLSEDRFLLHRNPSTAAAAQYENESLDWVYIDAGHSFEDIKADYEAWFPKVRTGGIISGHDYGLNDCIGVKQFIDSLGIEFNLTTDDTFDGVHYQSWWFIKK